MYKTSVFVLCCFSAALAAPPIKKCTAQDSQCIKQSAQQLIVPFANGIPEYKVQTLDPLQLTKEIDASSPSLKLKVRNMVVTGMKGCTAVKMERDIPKSKLYTTLLCDVHAEGQYEMKGRLLVLPIEGKGGAQVTLKKIQMSVESDLSDRTGRDGKKHWQIKSSRFSYELKDKSTLHFENLFNGNKLLAATADEVIRTNSNEIVMEIGKPIIKAIVDKIIENVNHFYKTVPVEQFAYD
ncbi:hypothetical protein ACJJTC_013854 [Scirpophaga incertulas]